MRWWQRLRSDRLGAWTNNAQPVDVPAPALPIIVLNGPLLRPVALFVRNPAISVSVTAAIAQDHGLREEEACRLQRASSCCSAHV